MILVLFLSLPLWCQATGSLESESNFHNGLFSTQFQWWIQGNFGKSSFGYFGWALVSKGWSEIYPGLSWQPASWIQMGVGAGIEQTQSKVRFGEFLWVGKGKLYFLGFTEHGGSGFWYRAMTMYKWTKDFQVGLMSQHGLGIGPKMEFEFLKPFSLWVATLFWERSTTVFGGLKLNF